MKNLCIPLLLLIIFRLTPNCSAATPDPTDSAFVQSSSGHPIVSSEGISSGVSGEPRENFRLEISGNYNRLDNDYGDWKTLELRLRYSGLKKVTPFGSISTQSRKEGSQRNYALGSYIHFNPRFYMIAGISYAPVRDPDIIIYPKLRMDLSGYIGIPAVEGLVLKTGVSHFPKQNGNGGDIISAGLIYYYRKFVLSGTLNYNISRPGNITSMSGEANIMYGQEGKYWIGGGATAGRVAYQLASEIPFDVRYETRGANMFYRKWIGKNWGVNTQLDYQDLIGAYRLKGATIALFIDF